MVSVTYTLLLESFAMANSRANLSKPTPSEPHWLTKVYLFSLADIGVIIALLIGTESITCIKAANISKFLFLCNIDVNSMNILYKHVIK